MADGKEVFRTPPGALRLRKNECEQPGDGGVVALALAMDEAGTKELYYERAMNGVSVTLNYLLDKGMDAFATAKVDMLKKRYTLVIYEESPPPADVQE